MPAAIELFPFRRGMETNAVRYCRRPSGRSVPKIGVMISWRCQGASRSGCPAFAPAVCRRCVSKNSRTRCAGAFAFRGGNVDAGGCRLGPALIAERGEYSASWPAWGLGWPRPEKIVQPAVPLDPVDAPRGGRHLALHPSRDRVLVDAEVKLPAHLHHEQREPDLADHFGLVCHDVSLA